VSYTPIPLEFERLTPGEQLARSREFLVRVRTRRSVREFSHAPVPFELVANAIAAAGTAPSGANQQPWTFVVVSDAELKRQIRSAAEAEERQAYEHRMTEEWLRALEPLGTDWRKPHIEDAPYVIVVFEQAYGLDGGRRWKHYYAKESVGIAVGLLLASLHLAGLATLTHTPSPMGFLARILDRPRNERAFCLIPVGYPADGATVPKLEKKPLEQILVLRERAIV
jgi:iodotyrosine deiodinase